MNYGSAGAGTISNLAGELFKNLLAYRRSCTSRTRAAVRR